MLYTVHYMEELCDQDEKWMMKEMMRDTGTSRSQGKDYSILDYGKKNDLMEIDGSRRRTVLGCQYTVYVRSMTYAYNA